MPLRLAAVRLAYGGRRCAQRDQYIGLLWGAEFGAAKMIDMARLWEGVATNLRAMSIPLCGHLLQEEQPKLVTAELLKCLEWHG